MTIEAAPAPPPQPKQPPPKAAIGALIGVVGIGCAAILSPLVSGFESGGKQHLTAYPDIVGVYTICDGDTTGVKAGDTETADGCKLRLDKRLSQFAADVLKCTPSLHDHDNQLAATISLSYNIGTKAYCASTVDRRFDAHQWRSACDAYLMWDRAGGKVIQGLLNRRRAERSLCLKDLPA